MVALKVNSTQQHIQTAEHDTELWQRAHKPKGLNLTGKLVIYSRLRIVRSEEARPGLWVSAMYIKKEKIHFFKVPFFELW